MSVPPRVLRLEGRAPDFATLRRGTLCRVRPIRPRRRVALQGLAARPSAWVKVLRLLGARQMNRDERRYTVRQATEADLPALADIKSPMAIHKDRLRDADGDRLLYMVIEDFGTVIGFGLLVFERPPTWPDAKDKSHVPAMVDLLVRPDRRGRGAGPSLISWMEETVRSRGGTHLYMGVDPVDNPRVHQLYLRLGYTPLQTQPYRSHWKFTDSDGNVHEGNEWNVDMVKDLSQETRGAPNNCVERTR